MEGQVAHTEGFKNTDKLTSRVRYLIYLQIIMAVISFVSGFMEYQLLSDFKNGVYTSQEQAVADGENSDFR